MSLMTQSLLMEAQSLRLEGDMDGSIAILRVVISNCNADKVAADAEHQITHQLWEMASYQLSLLLLQNCGRFSNQASEREADNILMKLGYRLRLSTKAFGYPACECAFDKSSCNLKTNEAKLPLLMIDDILPHPFFNALRHSLRPDSRYWTDFYSKTNEVEEGGKRRQSFASHNVSLPNSTELTYAKCIEKASSLIEQVAIIVKHCLTQKFPSILAATSAEVWSHRRPPDAQHQLHYDMDEIRLHICKQRHNDECNTAARGNKRQKVGNLSEELTTTDLCPIISCVLTVNVPNQTKTCDRCGMVGDGAPTLVCNQSLLGRTSNEGWLCYPRLNRLVAFDGSLLHAVVPGIPSEVLGEDEDDYSRVTLMIGFWKDVTLSIPDKTSQCLTIGPNVPFPSSLLAEFKPIAVDENTVTKHMHAAIKHVVDPNLVRPLWTEIDQAGDCNEAATISEKDSSGRFFLRSTDPTEIDKKVLGF
ncbi:hypothetical protein QTG54_007098 [Skeletonema marinoi]|uniref:Uncharacterized protein n=1 Tax=Skeletonema marinoi TaxID=267567 RepID=A0AAD8YB70_9STRA|nr:hypothetical protein QTG54_007098 [Skeletonema marinoi]